MKVTITKGYFGYGKYAVKITQGGQSFLLDHRGTRADCLWYAKMFRKALAAHDTEVIERYFKGDAR